jgi:hypothetical protein
MKPDNTQTAILQLFIAGRNPAGGRFRMGFGSIKILENKAYNRTPPDAQAFSATNHTPQLP